MTPITWAIAVVLLTIVGWTRCSTPCSRALRDAEQLDAEAEFGGRVDVGERHALYALDVDGARRRCACRRRAR